MMSMLAVLVPVYSVIVSLAEIEIAADPLRKRVGVNVNPFSAALMSDNDPLMVTVVSLVPVPLISVKPVV